MPPAGLLTIRRSSSARLRRWPGAEILVAFAALITLLAIYYRVPLTTESLDIGPGGIGRIFDAYSYDDRSSGGESAARYDPKHPLSWSCDLRSGGAFQWPYCGFGLLFDRQHSGHGIDLSRFQTISLHLTYRGWAKLMRLTLKDHDSLFGSADKVNQATIAVRNGTQSIPLMLSDLTVAEWWVAQTHATGDLAHPSFRDVVAIEIITGEGSKDGRQDFRIDGMHLERRLIDSNPWYSAIAFAWLMLISGLLVHRRKQLTRLRRSAAKALSESERLHRSILETSTDCIVVMSPDGMLEYVNSAGIATFELPPIDDIRDKHWTNFWSTEELSGIAAAIERASAGESIQVQGPAPTAKGTPRWWDVTISPMLNDSGTIKGVLSVSRDITAERERSEQLKWASEHDALTHLPNRRSFQTRLQAATLGALEAGDQVGLLLIDLDHFKHVNDSLGHSAGDELLKSVGERLRTCVRADDFVARIGGDEFAIVLENACSEEVLLRVGKKVQDHLRTPVRAGGKALAAGASIGGAMFPANASTASDLFKYADTALYELKHNGRGGTKLFDDYMLAEAERVALQLDLARRALTVQTVVPLYQPKVNIMGGEVVGVEALLRWRHPRRGLQLPATIEEAFSDYELATKIGELMQQKVAKDIRQWLLDDVDFGRVSINAAPAEFLRDDYAERLLAILALSDVPASRIEVEVTEHAFLGRGPEYVARALDLLKDAGATVSLDDFGTGCSSLAHLRDFPVDVVKLDKSFIQQMTDDPEISAIVAAVIDLATCLSIGVVAEGVETHAQLDLLRIMGCRIGQGHLFGVPVEASEIARLMPAIRAAA
jgi:diguanylate cyclase (GGDEF)-like protein/PAS domain S-box-containing protein